jgi:hypothetical protein
MDKEKNTGRKLGKKGLLGLGFAFVLIVALVIGGTSGAFGLLKDSTSGVTAQYQPATVDCKVIEPAAESEGTELKPYQVENTGTTPALIRAKVVMNWTGEGETIVYDASSSFPAVQVVKSGDADAWVLIDGFYYYNGILGPGETCEFFTVDTTGLNRELQIIVLAEAIQAKPTEAAADAWKLTYNNGWPKP